MIVSDLKKFKNKKIMVIGDLMIDHYIYGDAERISGEAPVPVVDVYKEEYRLGGAANVIYNLKNLGAEPYFLSVTGDDELSQKVNELFVSKNIINDHLITDKSRRTTLKTRIIAQNQQVLRIDKEDKHFIDEEIENKIIDKFEILLPNMDAIILEDYNKGLLSKKVITKIIKLANSQNKIIAVDPKFINFHSYNNVTVFKPNIKELENSLGRSIDSESDLIEGCRNLMNELKMKFIVVTQGEDGLLIYKQNGDVVNIPTFAKQVYDVSGAGDTVIATLTLAYSIGLSIDKSAEIANHAAGAVCAKVGITPVSPSDIINSYKNFYE